MVTSPAWLMVRSYVAINPGRITPVVARIQGMMYMGAMRTINWKRVMEKGRKEERKRGREEDKRR
jgi:hypothetical protein